MTHIHTELPVYSVVIYLREDSPLVESPHVIWFPNGKPTQRLDFDTIKLWEVEPGAIEQPGLAGLLPLLPLTKDGKNHETILRMTDTLKKVGKKDLIVMGYACSCLVFTTVDERRWLQERFFEMKDLLSDTWVFQEIKREGLQEGLQRTLVNTVRTKFPDLAEFAQCQARHFDKPEVLESLIQQVVVASDAAAVLKLLQSEAKTRGVREHY